MRKKNGKRAGFTLIELMVVITIIGLLTVIIVPSIGIALRSAKKTRALSQIRDLDGAVKRYFAEYGKMPVPAGQNGGADRLYMGAEQAQVIEILINESLDANANPKNIVFLDLDPISFGVKTRVEMLALLASGTPYAGPWPVEHGRPQDYHLLMDLNFDDRITGVNIPDLTDDHSTIRAKSAVFSWGEPPDKEENKWNILKTW